MFKKSEICFTKKQRNKNKSKPPFPSSFHVPSHLLGLSSQLNRIEQSIRWGGRVNLIELPRTPSPWHCLG